MPTDFSDTTEDGDDNGRIFLMDMKFYFWAFEISGNFLRNQKIYRFRLMYSKQVLAIWTPFGFILVI